MSRDRITPCKFYISYGSCEKGRNAEMRGYCQTCDKYEPRAKIRHKNLKKSKLEKYKREGK